MTHPPQDHPLVLDTPRMHLRRVRESDLDDLLSLDSDPEVMRYISGGKPSTREMYIDRLLPRMTSYADQPYGYLSAFTRQAAAPHGPFIGWFHLRPSVADAEVLELGYRLVRSVWGQGLASEGARALVRYAFEELGHDVVDACADPKNEASTRVMEKCGMRPAGSFKHPLVDLVVVRYLVRRDDPSAPDPIPQVG